jgi:hypothetical protein
MRSTVPQGLGRIEITIAIALALYPARVDDPAGNVLRSGLRGHTASALVLVCVDDAAGDGQCLAGGPHLHQRLDAARLHYRRVVPVEQGPSEANLGST